MNNVNQTAKYCLLLTGCIAPSDIPFLERKDPKQREDDYYQALKFYLSHCRWPIVFCDNSNTRSEKLAKLIETSNRSDIEYITFEGRNFPLHLGKGYGEVLIIKKALAESVLTKQAEFILKITGRLIVENIKEILFLFECEMAKKHYDVMGNLKYDLKYCNSRIFLFKKEFIEKYFVPHLSKLNDSANIFFEHVLAMAILSSILDGKSFSKLPCLPKISGHSGTFNTALKTPYTKFKIKNLLYCLAESYLKRDFTY
jgi:hypothetical protein